MMWKGMKWSRLFPQTESWGWMKEISLSLLITEKSMPVGGNNLLRATKRVFSLFKTLSTSKDKNGMGWSHLNLRRLWEEKSEDTSVILSTSIRILAGIHSTIKLTPKWQSCLTSLFPKLLKPKYQNKSSYSPVAKFLIWREFKKDTQKESKFSKISSEK